MNRPLEVLTLAMKLWQYLSLNRLREPSTSLEAAREEILITKFIAFQRKKLNRKVKKKGYV